MKKLFGCFVGLACILGLALAGQTCTTDADCDDANACNGAEYCQAGVCFGRAPLVCNDGDPCTIDGCDSASGCTVTPSPGACMLGGDKIKMGTSRITHLSIQTAGTIFGGAFPVQGSTDDPVFHGASLRLFSTHGDVFDNTYGLPSNHWAYVGTGTRFGYIYKDISGSVGPIRTIVVRQNRPTKIKGGGPALNYTLLTDPYPVQVQIRYGEGLMECLTFGGVRKFTAGKLFQSLRAPAPPTCPAP